MGTNIPHTCIPGLVWQKQARRFSQFELKVGELGFPIHFVCVSAALYHRGHAAAIFSPYVNTVHLSPKDDFDQLINFQGPVISECTYSTSRSLQLIHSSKVESARKIDRNSTTYSTSLTDRQFFGLHARVWVFMFFLGLCFFSHARIWFARWTHTTRNREINHWALMVKHAYGRCPTRTQLSTRPLVTGHIWRRNTPQSPQKNGGRWLW